MQMRSWAGSQNRKWSSSTLEEGRLNIAMDPHSPHATSLTSPGNEIFYIWEDLPVSEIVLVSWAKHVFVNSQFVNIRWRLHCLTTWTRQLNHMDFQIHNSSGDSQWHQPSSSSSGILLTLDGWGLCLSSSVNATNEVDKRLFFTLGDRFWQTSQGSSNKHIFAIKTRRARINTIFFLYFKWTTISILCHFVTRVPFMSSHRRQGWFFCDSIFLIIKRWISLMIHYFQLNANYWRFNLSTTRFFLLIFMQFFYPQSEVCYTSRG